MPKDEMPTLSYYSSAENLMGESERKDAVTALKFLMIKLRDIPGTYAQFADIKEPLPAELSLILRFLAETCKQLIAFENENSSSNETVISAKQLCAAARIVRQILHVQQVSDYRALGLNDGATQEQIHKHYRWLSSLFAFDEGIDPERHSTRRTMQAYISLKGSGLSLEGDPVLSDSVSGTQQRDSLNSDTTLDANERLTVSDSVSDAHEKTVVASMVTLDSRKVKRSGMGIAASILIFLTVASGVGWWWLLSGHDVKNIETTSLKERMPLKNESQDITMLEESLINEPELVMEEKSDLQRETNVATPLQLVPPAALFAPLDDEVTSIPEIKSVKPNVPIETTSGPVDEVAEKAPIVITANTKQNEKQKLEKESIKAVKTESKVVRGPAVSAPEVQDTVQLELPSTPVVSQEDEMETLTDVAVVEVGSDFDSLENEKVQALSSGPAELEIEQPINVVSPIPAVVVKIPPPSVADESTVQPTSPAIVESPESQLFNKALENVIVVIGSPNLDMSSLNVEEVTNIFLGKVTRLPGGQIIEVFDQEDGSTIKRNFYESVMGKTSRQIKAHWSKLQFKGFVDFVHPPEALRNDKSTKKRVAAAEFAIGYINGSALDGSVKVLHIVK